MRKRKNTKLKNTAIGTLLFGVLFSFAVLIVLSLASSFLLVGFKNPTSNIRIASLTVFLITAAVSGFAVSKHRGAGGIAFSALTSLLFIAVLFAVAIIISKGKISGALFMNYLCYMMISSFTAVIGTRKPKRHSHKHR